MRKRDVCNAMVDGARATAADIVASLRGEPVTKDVNATRTILWRLFKDGMVCEVLPRNGRKKLWIITSQAIVNVDHRFQVTIDVKTGNAVAISRVKPDRYVIAARFKGYFDEKKGRHA